MTVGTLGRAHGLGGEVFIDLRTDSPDLRFSVGSTLWVDNVPLTVRGFRPQGGRAVVSFDEIGDRGEAEKLTGASLVARVDSSESPRETDEYFDHQLVGLDVVDEDGVRMGTLTRVDHLGFQDLLAVDTIDGERLIPFVDDLVPEVDLEGRRVVVRVIPGLLKD